MSVGSYEDKKILNVCNSTDNDKELFGAMIEHNKNMNNVFISNGYNNFLVSNQQQQNCPMVQMPALPMFNYCQNMGFYQNYNNLNNFFNMYNNFWSNNSYNYCMGQFYDNGKITQQANAQLYPYRQFTPQFMMNKLEAQMKIAKGLNTANFNRNLFISCPNQSDVKSFPSENLKRPANFMYNVNNDMNDANAFNNIKRNIGDNDNIINQDAINGVKTINDCNIKQLFNMNNEKQNNKKHRKRKNIKKQRQSRINKSEKFNAKLMIY